MKEIYKDIPNYEGLYQVSNLGNVKSLHRVITRSNDKVQTIKEKFLKPILGSHGYLAVGLYKNKKQKLFLVHVLMAIVFFNHKPKGNTIVVDHINNDRTDNRLDNLQLISHRENVSKDLKNGTSKYVGVSWNKKAQKWGSSIRIKGKSKHIGYFTDELKASKAYQNKLLSLSV